MRLGRAAAVAGGILGLAMAGPSMAQAVFGGPSRSTPGVFVSPAGEVFRSLHGEDPLDDWWRQADANGDGGVSPEEFGADFDRAFMAFDADHDGIISAGEIAAYNQSLHESAGIAAVSAAAAAPPPPARRPPPLVHGSDSPPSAAPPPPRRPTGLSPYNPLGEDNPLMSADTDNSGSITLAEFRAKAQRAFAQLDLNGDHQVRRIELPALGDPQHGRTSTTGAQTGSRPWAQ